MGRTEAGGEGGGGGGGDWDGPISALFSPSTPLLPLSTLNLPVIPFSSVSGSFLKPGASHKHYFVFLFFRLFCLSLIHLLFYCFSVYHRICPLPPPPPHRLLCVATPSPPLAFSFLSL